MMLFVVLQLIIATLAGVVPSCEPPNNCSVHVFRVTLSQKPDSDVPAENTTTVTVVQRKKHGNNYFEINAHNISEQLAKEIMQKLPENADPRLKEKISSKNFYLKPVEGGENSEVMSFTIPPPPPSSTQTSHTPTHQHSTSQFPFLLVALLICIGLVLGILITFCCILFLDFQRQPEFDRTNAITYKRSIDSESLIHERVILARPQPRKMPSAHSQLSASGRRINNLRHPLNPPTSSNTSRQISL